MRPVAGRFAFWLAAVLLLVLHPAWGQPYPGRPVRMVVPFVPGGSIDTVARVVAVHWSTVLGQQIVLDNRGGAGGTVGTELVAKATPDGYTILYGNSGPLAIAPHLYDKLGYDLFRDLAPVSQVTTSPFMVFASTSLPVASTKELIDYAKARPGQLNYASSGIGSGLHLVGELFKSVAGVNIVHVPFKGLGQAVADIASGRVQLVMSTVAAMVPHVRGGRLRGIVSTGTRRSPQLPEAPTCIEAGLPGLQATSWHAVMAPAKTPAAVVLKLQQTLAGAISKPDARDAMARDDAEAVGGTPEELGRFLRAESTKWGSIIKAVGVRAE
jgi:tripartite-type tricarboxylate transporter receptor subunit TctC